MTLVRIARRVTIGLLFAAVLVIPGAAQDGYRTPPDAITKIIMPIASPAMVSVTQVEPDGMNGSAASAIATGSRSGR